MITIDCLIGATLRKAHHVTTMRKRKRAYLECSLEYGVVIREVEEKI